MIKIERAINNPGDIAHIVFRAAEIEIDEAIQENKKRVERFKKPLPMPRWNVKEMLENLNYLTEKTFTPHFKQYAFEHPWNGKSSAKDWAEIATVMLRDYYLLPLSHEDKDLFQQMCDIWKDIIPEPNLTKEQMDELINLQKQADAIMERAEKLVTEFVKLAEREKEIVIGTQSKLDRRIANQIRFLRGNMFHYHDKHVAKW
jgi:hypothetical protein